MSFNLTFTGSKDELDELLAAYPDKLKISTIGMLIDHYVSMDKPSRDRFAACVSQPLVDRATRTQQIIRNAVVQKSGAGGAAKQTKKAPKAKDPKDPKPKGPPQVNKAYVDNADYQAFKSYKEKMAELNSRQGVFIGKPKNDEHVQTIKAMLLEAAGYLDSNPILPKKDGSDVSIPPQFTAIFSRAGYSGTKAIDLARVLIQKNYTFRRLKEVQKKLITVDQQNHIPDQGDPGKPTGTGG